MAHIETPPARPVATLDEVARVAGVSRATVSRVVNGSPKVSADVRRSVEKAIDRLGYVPNRAARSLVTRRSDSIAVVITEPANRLFNDPFFPRLIRGVSAALSARDLQLVLLEKEDAVGFHQTGHNSGVLHAGLYYQPGSLKARLCVEGKAAIEAFCEAHGIPVERPGKLVIALDDLGLGRLAAVKERALANGVPGLQEVGPRELVPLPALPGRVSVLCR